MSHLLEIHGLILGLKMNEQNPISSARNKNELDAWPTHVMEFYNWVTLAVVSPLSLSTQVHSKNRTRSVFGFQVQSGLSLFERVGCRID